MAGTVHDGPCGSARDRVGGEIVALTGRRNGRDVLAAFVGPDTTVLEDPDFVVLPAFVDTHNHLCSRAATSSESGLPGPGHRDLHRAAPQGAARPPAGQWIVTGADWHELRLAERRMPTAEDLDRATVDRPVLAMRGGHCVCGA